MGFAIITPEKKRLGMPYSFSLELMIVVGKENDFLELSDAIHVGCADNQTFLVFGSLRDHLWICARHQTRHSLRIWTEEYDPMAPVLIFSSFYEYQLGISDFYEEFLEEHSEAEHITDNWDAFIAYRRWEISQGFFKVLYGVEGRAQEDHLGW